MALDVFGEPVNPPVDPLVSAASKGDLKAMGTLLGQGVDVNALGGTHGNALTEAASRGRLGAIKFLLDRGADVNAVGGDLRTALEAAARNKNLDALKLLIRSGADLNATGGAALGVAASCKNLDAVKLLVAQGTNVNTAGGLVLQNAVKLGELDIIELLLEKGADPNAQWHGHPTPLVLAASSGKLDVIKLLLDKGADLNARWNDPAFGDMGTPLVAAAINGKLDVIELLLDKGADLNVQRVDCRNALSSAAGAGRLDAVELLLARGAHVNGLDDDYITSLTAVDGNELHYAFETPLLCSIRGEHMPIASLLIDRGANVRDPRCHLVAAAAEAPHSSSSFIKLLVDAGVSVKDRCEGALQISSKRGILDDLQLLLGLGADVNEQGGLFGNPLQAAAYCSRGDLDVVELLLREGANVNAKGGRYGSVLQAAVCATHENLDLIQMILDQGADVNMQGGFCGSSLQAAASLGRNKIVKLLLRRGANVNLCVGDKQGASLLHTAVACQDIRTLDLLLEAGAHTYISHTDTLGQTPLYIAIDHPECFQSLKASLDLALNSEEGNKWKNLLSSAIDKADFDGCAPLHRAVENNFLDAAEWLIDHDANVHIPDFNGVTAFQRASHLRRIDLMSKIFPHVMKLGKVEISIKATDWRAAQSSRWKNYIMLALNGSKLPSVQVFDGVELVKFFHAISYPLDYRSTSDVPTQDDKCIANASFQRALVLLPDDRLLNHSSNGFYLRWWRKVLIKNPDILITRKTYLYDRCETLWIWKVQLNQFPSVVALSQPSRTQCFLECRLILPSCEIFHTDTLSSPASLKIRRKNHAVIWILVKSEKDQTPSTSTSPEVLLECKVVFTTLEDCEIPEKPDDAILIPCIKQLADEWIQVFQAAENHLSQMRSETFRSNGRNKSLINEHLRDAQSWNEFKTLFSNQMTILRSFHERFFLKWRQLGLKAPPSSTENPFVDEIENVEKIVKERLLSLDLISRELIQLEFNLTSIAEAQKSTSMNTSMKRLSWITFIFLPLMFISSLFGMNIDLLASNPSWWLYIPFAAGTIILTLSIWILFKTRKGLEDTIEQRLRGLFKRNKVGDEESLGHFDLDLRKKRTTHFSAFGKKRS